VWSHRLEIEALVLLFSLAVCGALLAILMRVGVVQLTYSDDDKHTRIYKMSKSVAEMEQDQKRGFSDSYYENLGVKPPKKKESDD
jgi:hypothetical protein